MNSARKGRDQPAPGNGKKYWLDEPRNVAKIYRALWIVCGALAAAEFFYLKLTHFDFEGFPGFFGIFGFVVCVGLVLGAKELRKILMRDEDYYDR